MPTKKKIHYKEQQLNICVCGVEAQVDSFTWANLGGHMVLLCWDCTDKVHKDFITKERKEGLGEKF